MEIELPGGADRFTRAAAAMDDLWAGNGGDAPSRVYGGFSFSDGHRREAVWEAFPSVRFQLPAVELACSGAGAGCTLTVRAPDGRGAQRTADRWVAALEDEAGYAAGHNVIEASTVGSDHLRWSLTVRRALEAIESGGVEKIVLARAMDVFPNGLLDPAEVALTLWEENRSSHVFLFEPEEGRALLGAAPEVLAWRAGTSLRATAVAGSIGVGSSSEDTSDLARKLFDSEKDRAEHGFVVDDMVRILTSLGCDVRRDIEPHVLTLARIQHLETKIEATLPPDLKLLEILAGLHPTPAVCGLPRDVAASFLEESESFQRGWYAGPVGWIDAEGEGVFVPALRSAVSVDGAWRLFAGAGIVSASDPELEWEETALKFQPVLRALVRAGASSEILHQVA